MKHLRSGKSIQLLGHGQRGFTLMELMVAVTVLAILLGLAVPTFRETIQMNRIVAQNNDFISTLNFARSEAIKRSDTVAVCPSTDGLTCAGAVADWSTGWISFTDLNGDGDKNGADIVLQAAPATTDNIVITTPAALGFIRYNGSGMVLSAVASTFNVYETGCVGNKARTITVYATGRASTVTSACP
jgi:type IV fimbrial biogenesis protein FimT